MNTTEKIYRLNTDKDMYYEIANGVQKPIARSIALAAIVNTSAMLQSGSWVTFTVGYKS